MKKNNEMMWALLLHMERNMFLVPENQEFDENVWKEVVEEAAKSGYNTLIVDLGNSVRYTSHPELVYKKAWSKERFRNEIAWVKSLGMEIIPKINFSTTHDQWLGEYGRMVSTNIYYGVCRDIITEVGELFQKPKYIHIGMDEEDAENAKGAELVVYRHKELIWHDLQFLCECVRDVGSTPWIWADHCFSKPEDFRKNISCNDIVLSPWMYHAIKPEHYTLISSDQEYIDYYKRPQFVNLNLTYVEEDPFHTNFREQALPCVNDGYNIVPCVSTFNKCYWNTPDVLEYFKENAPKDRLLGFLMAPWRRTCEIRKEEIINAIHKLKEAREMLY